MGYFYAVLRWLRGKHPVHCWEGISSLDTDDGVGRTCFLYDRHLGSHRWSRDSEIMVSFPEAQEEPHDAL